MNWSAPLEVVFLTNFSDTCFRVIPSIAQMVDDLSIHLTILHSFEPGKRNRSEAEAWESPLLRSELKAKRPFWEMLWVSLQVV